MGKPFAWPSSRWVPYRAEPICMLTDYRYELLLFVKLLLLLLPPFLIEPEVGWIIHLVVIDAAQGHFDGACSDIIHKGTVVRDDDYSLCTADKKFLKLYILKKGSPSKLKGKPIYWNHPWHFSWGAKIPDLGKALVLCCSDNSRNLGILGNDHALFRDANFLFHVICPHFIASLINMKGIGFKKVLAQLPGFSVH